MAESSLRALSKLDRTLNPYVPKEMDMISTLWRARGLLGKWKTDEKFFKYVQNVMNSEAARKGGYASLGKALDHIFGKGNYKGLPLGYDKTGSSAKGDRKVTKVYWNKRKVQQTIPLHIRDRVARLEKDGTFEKAGIKPGILDRIEARNKKGLTRLQKETRRLEKLYGIKFEMGHLTAIANLGTDNPLNLFPELKSENRAHGAREDPLDSKTQMELGMGGSHEIDLYEAILEEGGNPAVLGVSSKDWTSGDQGKLARMGADPNQVGFARRNAILNRTLQKLEQDLEKASKDGNLLQFVDNINSRITEKGYQSIAPTLKPQPKGEILKVIPKQNQELLIDQDKGADLEITNYETPTGLNLNSGENLEITNYKDPTKRWNFSNLFSIGPNPQNIQPFRPPGEGFNRNIEIASTLATDVGEGALRRNPYTLVPKLGVTIGHGFNTGDWGPTVADVLGARITTTTPYWDSPRNIWNTPEHLLNPADLGK